MRKLIWRVLVLASSVACFAMLSSAPASAQSTKRLIMTDGSYQAASQWEIKGERVRYYSTERGDWEEVPKALVDWKATDQWEADRAKLDDAKLKAESEDEKAEMEKLRANTVEVAPGAQLPEEGGVWALDKLNDHKQLEQLMQSGEELNRHKTENILRSVINPLPSSKQTIDVEGAQSKVRVHTAMPTIFINVEGLPAEAGQPVERFRIIRLKAEKDHRVVTDIRIGIRGVKSTQQFVPSKMEKFSGDWLKLSPTEPLKSGEYAVVELMSDRDVNTYVWDFGVDIEGTPEK
jgi:hypothetical protein